MEHLNSNGVGRVFFKLFGVVFKTFISYYYLLIDRLKETLIIW